MDKPTAFQLLQTQAADVHTVKIEPTVAKGLASQIKSDGPAILVARSAVILEQLNIGVVSSTELLAVVGGRWDDAILVVLPKMEASKPERRNGTKSGDDEFLDQTRATTPDLADLASVTLESIRAKGVDGDLVREGERWVNRPINTFTLKVQPRVGNLHFTIYGNPSSYNAGGFLLKDQNSYSRGWVRSEKDAMQLAELARIAHSRRVPGG